MPGVHKSLKFVPAFGLHRTQLKLRRLAQTLEFMLDFPDTHARMIRDVFLRTEIMLNDHVTDISEYDIQALMFLYFRNALKNTNYSAARERNGKVDCVLFDGTVPLAFYEIKTYFKEHEKLKKADFDKDIEKLKALAKKHSDTRAYFIVAGLKSKFKEIDESIREFVDQHVHQDSRKWQEYEISDTSVSRIRPSQKQKAGRSVVVSWEIKL